MVFLPVNLGVAASLLLLVFTCYMVVSRCCLLVSCWWYISGGSICLAVVLYVLWFLLIEAITVQNFLVGTFFFFWLQYLTFIQCLYRFLYCNNAFLGFALLRLISLLLPCFFCITNSVVVTSNTKQPWYLFLILIHYFIHQLDDPYFSFCIITFQVIIYFCTHSINFFSFSFYVSLKHTFCYVEWMCLSLKFNNELSETGGR